MQELRVGGVLSTVTMRRVPPRRHRESGHTVGQQLTADQYLEHWKKNKIWTHNDRPKHQLRFNFCASNIVGETFVDVGCLLGHSTAALKAKHPGSWTGVDFTAAAVAEARTNFPAIDFAYLREIGQLPMLGKFDSVVCSEVLEHVPDDAELMRNLVAIARRRVVATTPNHNAGDPGHVRQYTDATMRALLAPYGGTYTKDAYFFYVTVNVG